MDVHVPYAITFGLRLRGIDVLTSQEDGANRLSDSDLLDRATLLGRILISQDSDLLREASYRQRLGLVFGRVIFAPQTAVTIGACVDDLELIASFSEPDEWISRLDYLPLK
jgi:hypothetical protein